MPTFRGCRVQFRAISVWRLSSAAARSNNRQSRDGRIHGAVIIKQLEETIGHLFNYKAISGRTADGFQAKKLQFSFPASVALCVMDSDRHVENSSLIGNCWSRIIVMFCVVFDFFELFLRYQYGLKNSDNEWLLQEIEMALNKYYCVIYHFLEN